MQRWDNTAKRKWRVLIVSDGKRGHVHQTEGVVRKLHNVIGKKFEITIGKGYYLFLVFISIIARHVSFSHPFILFLVQKVTKSSMSSLIKFSPDLIISAGSFTHPVTYLLSKIWNSKTVVCMRPSLLSVEDFDLVVVPRHDEYRCRGGNIIYTMGATSHISEGFIFAEAAALYPKLKGEVKRPIGLLIGGNSSRNFITPEMAQEIVGEVLLACEENEISVLTTTSRRTPLEAEKNVKEQLEEHPNSAYLLLASESNDNPVPGIIGMCEVVIVTEDSVSMVSEIISGGKYAIVVKVGRSRKGFKFEKLFNDLMDEQYITYTSIEGINRSVTEVLKRKKRGFKPLDESRKVAVEIERRFFGEGSGTGVKRE
ncbi:MAG TPA: ELM1/GtrOC1 family putative glycosyltransferase [bacterium]|nr:ELM1/GtrOC1 family putative glycosyltransferase [bacterium]